MAHIIAIVNIIIIIRVTNYSNFYQSRVIYLELLTVPYNFVWTCYTSTDNTNTFRVSVLLMVILVLDVSGNECLYFCYICA